MKYTKQDNGQRVISWWFNGPDLNNDEVNKEWGCYKNCSMIVKNNTQNGQLLFTSKMPTQNGCDSWYNIPPKYNSYFNNIESFCVKIVCNNDKESDIYCWKEK